MNIEELNKEWKIVDEYDNYIVSRKGLIVNDVTGFVLSPFIKNGYAFVQIDGKSNQVHRLVAKTFIENPDNFEQVDHLDRDKLNNMVENLRWCSHADNQRNKTKFATRKGIPTVSRFKGVCWNKATQKWKASFTVNGKIQFIGHYDNEIDAARAWNESMYLFYDNFVPNNTGEVVDI
jgi:hypothetical protein